MTDKPRQRYSATANDSVNRDERQHAEQEDGGDKEPNRSQQAAEKKALLAKLADYEPSIAYD